MNFTTPTRRDALAAVGASALAIAAPTARAQSSARVQSWPLATPSRTGIHDVAPAPDGGVWFSAQRSGHLGWFDPKSGRTELVALGRGSSPHGVIQGPDGAAWLTDGGQNAIVRVGWPDRALRVFALPEGSSYANLNTAAFDGDGDLWLTGQSGIVGKLAVKSGVVSIKDAPKGRGPYGICATPAARSGGVRLPARSSRASIARRANRSLSNHRRRTRARAASGATAAAASGSASGTRGSCRCTTRRRRRQRKPGALGSCRATSRAATPSMSTSATSSGAVTSAAMQSGASTRRVKNSSASVSCARPPASARSSAGRARSGCPKVAPSTSR